MKFIADIVSWWRSKERAGMSKRIRDLKSENLGLTRESCYWRNRALHAENYIERITDDFKYGDAKFKQEYPR